MKDNGMENANPEPGIGFSAPKCGHDGTTQSPAVPPVAIVGMAMRLPGDVRTANEFWELLISKRDCSSEVPKSRYNIDSFYHPEKPQSVRTRRGYFLNDDFIQKSDKSFFPPVPGFTTGDLDPQQMSLMEVVWECMENAGQTQWRGKKIGCYVGVFGEDWHELTAKETQYISRAHTFANGGFALSNRVSYEFDLKGPSATVLTACSSSLMALHEACQALYNGSCTSAIVAGTNMLLTPSMSVTMSENMVLSPDGYCKAFDANADGYGRGEAVNAILIKPLDQAMADGDNIRAIIRATAANYDGRTAKIFAPDVDSQERLMREAYSRAHIHDMSQTAFVECHGTGTKVGDLVETTAIARVFGKKGICIGSVKSNVGHGEGASGLTAIIKAVLALEHRIIPPNMHFTRPNPKIPFENGGLRVPVEPTLWPRDRMERVSVNCFGIGGSNAHAILDSSTAAQHSHRKEFGVPLSSHILAVSAHSKTALMSRLTEVQEYVEKNPHTVQDVAYTLGTRRDHLSHRAYLICDGKGNLSDIQSNAQTITTNSSVVFAFTGQGAQWAGMGRDLMNSFATFHHDIHVMDQILQEIESPPAWSIEAELRKSENSSSVDKTEYSQTLCAAIQIALVNLLATWGIHPSTLVGYSSGEVIAAYSAKAISMRSAIIIAHFRGRCAEFTSHCGGMAVVGLGKEIVSQFLIEGVVIACENSPQSVNISGDKSKLVTVIDRLLEERPQTFIRYLPVEVAYHSPDMKHAGANFERAIAPHIAHSDMMLPLYSTVTGSIVSSPVQLDASYWRKNLESPVLFCRAVQTLLDQQTDRATLFVEIGPHSTLSGPLRQILTSHSVQSYYTPTLLKNANQTHCLLKAVGEIYSHGYPVAFASIYRLGKVLADLPAYPWERQSIDWQESRLSRNWRFRKHPHHELLGSRMLEASDIEPAWRILLSPRNVSWLNDHQVLGEIVFPCAGYIAMVNEAMRQLFNTQECTIRNLHMKVPLVLPTSERDTVEIVTTLRPTRISDRLDSKWYEFTISSYDGNEWTKHTVGKAVAGVEELTWPATVPQQFAKPVSSQFWYKMLAKIGLQYGPQFQGLEDITADPISFTASATIRGSFGRSENSHALHPTSIDQCLQLFSVAACKGRAVHLTKLYIPMFIEEICLGQNKDLMKVQVSGSSSTGTYGQGSVTLMSGDSMVLSMRGATLAQLDQKKANEASGIPLLSEVEWQPDLDLLPGHLQLPMSRNKEDTAGLLARASVLSMILVHQNIVDVKPCSEHIRSYKRWLQAQIQIMRQRGISAIPEAQAWAQMDSESLQLQRNMLDEQLKAKKLDFLSELSHLTVKVKTAACKGSPDFFGTGDLLQKLDDWISSQSDLSDWFSFLRHSNPKLRILEIGGERGSFSSFVLQHLTSDGLTLCSQYTCTETLHINDAIKNRLQDYKQVEFRTLDVNEDPSQQGFHQGLYDLVIASNLGSRTSTLGAALKNIGKLLAPGGRLLLREYCPGLPVVNHLMVSNHTGDMDEENVLTSFKNPLSSQSFDELEIDVDSKYMSVETWSRELQQAGFYGVEGHSYDGKPPYHLNRNLISRIPREDHLHDDTVYFLYPSETPRHSWLCKVEEYFIQSGHTVKRCTIGEEIPHKQRVISFLDLDGPFFSNISDQNWAKFQKLINTSAQVLWVTNSVELNCANPDFALVMGVSRTARQEQEMQFGTLQIDIFDRVAVEALLKVSAKFFRRTDQSGLLDADYEFALHDGCVYIPRMQWKSLADRLLHAPELEAPAKLEIGSYGSLDSLFWVQDEVDPPGVGEVEVEIKFVGLNFRDVMIALGVMASKDQLGMEASGIVQRCGPGVNQFRPGDRVMIIHFGLFRTRMVLSANLCTHLPPSMSLEDSAGMPVAFATALYCLLDIGRLEKGQSVLIHAACGGVGLAAMQICQMIGAKVYATVGSEEKAQFLIERFGIPRNHIFSSRDTSFLPKLMHETNAQGVDIVINSLAGELLHASWKCVAEFGKMIEIGKRDFLEHGTLDLEAFGGNRAFFGVDLIRLAEKPELRTRLVRQLVELYEERKISPIHPLKLISNTDTHEAFRYLQQGLHMGKIVMKMPEASERAFIAKSRRSSRFSSDLCYFLVGGLGGIGRSIATWMVDRGARNLVFFSRSAGSTSQDQSFLRELELQGCTVSMIKGDVTILEEVQTAMHACPCPIGGVLQLSMIVRDQFIPEMSHKNWQDTIAAKVAGTWNLHNALDGRGAKLQFFVVCGSITGVMGNAGQVNYSAANTFVSSFAQYRLEKGLPASVVNLGGVNDVGFLATQDVKLRERMLSASVRLLNEQEVLDAFEVAIFCGDFKQSFKSSRSLRISNNLIVGMSSTKSLADPSVRPLWGQDARFRAYANLDFKHESSRDTFKDAPNFRYMLSTLEKEPEILSDPSWKKKTVVDIVQTIQKYSIFARGQDYAQVATMHIDSLMTVEIRNWSRRFLDLDLSLTAITKAATIEGLGELIIATLRSKYTKK
ncbi:hypothetical protein N7510_009981 [Penicillium lagena]|uniref:uncharacterized protein n=1 Tax=Penicillium lagena TaxID=94218 RepID=UPI00253FFCD9|nr:uncharacterized protein N7510_009981 [Penicillium lagena]KAJ5604827.1 hypothetical protein N7510_009981 [Penicillium lagena]